MRFNRFWGVLLSLASVSLINQQSFAQVPSSNLSPLTTFKLRDLARQQGICTQTVAVLFNQCVGLAFQATVVNLMGLRRNTIPFWSYERLLKTNRIVATVIPDATLPGYDEAKRLFPLTGYVEVKAVNGVLTLGSSRWQITGLIDITSEVPSQTSYPPPSQLVFVTTANTGIGTDVKNQATASKIALYQIFAYTDGSKICLINSNPLNNLALKVSVYGIITQVCDYLRFQPIDTLNDPDPPEVLDSP